MDHMHRRERVRAALAGNPVDRPQTEVAPSLTRHRWGRSHRYLAPRHTEALAASIQGAGEHTREGLLISPRCSVSPIPSRKSAGGPRHH